MAVARTRTGKTVVWGDGDKRLEMFPDPINRQKFIIQIYGPRGGLHGTTRIDISDFRQGLILTEVGKRRDK